MVLVVVSITWGLIRLAPGNFYTGEAPLPPAIERNIREKYGLDQPWYVQYGRMLAQHRSRRLRVSLTYDGQSVNSILADAVPVSATLGGLAYLLALIVGITAGTIAALRQNSPLDYASMAAAMVGISLPNFVLGPSWCSGFSLTWFWLPPARWDGFSVNLILPVVTLSAVYMAYIARLTRAGMLEVLRSNYIRTARAKGSRSEPVCCATPCAADCCRSSRFPARRWRCSSPAPSSSNASSRCPVSATTSSTPTSIAMSRSSSASSPSSSIAVILS